MSFTYGFYNSMNGDRKYNATQFGEMFDGLINDGIYSTIGDAFAVTPGSGLGVKVGTGRCWFNKTWSVNSTVLPLSLEMADLLLPRIDAVILEIDTRVISRTNSIKVITGAPNVTPVKPALTRSDGLYQYPLAWVRVDANAEKISASKIENNIGLSPTPFVTGIVQQATLNQLWSQWNSQFSEWFEGVKSSLSGDIASNLLQRIVALEDSRVKVSDKATTAEAQTGSNNTKWMTPSLVRSSVNYLKATDAQAQAGTATNVWITPKQMKTKTDLLELSINNVKPSGIVRTVFSEKGSHTFTTPANILRTRYIICVGGSGGNGNNQKGCYGFMGLYLGVDLKPSKTYTVYVGSNGGSTTSGNNTSGQTGGGSYIRLDSTNIVYSSGGSGGSYGSANFGPGVTRASTVLEYTAIDISTVALNPWPSWEGGAGVWYDSECELCGVKLAVGNKSLGGCVIVCYETY